MPTKNKKISKSKRVSKSKSSNLKNAESQLKNAQSQLKSVTLFPIIGGVLGLIINIFAIMWILDETVYKILFTPRYTCNIYNIINKCIFIF